MKQLLTSSFFHWVTRYAVILILFAIFSYSLTDPNLVLTSWSPYWQFQQRMWTVFFHNAPLLTYTYVGLVAGMFFAYFGLVRVARKMFADKNLAELISLKSFLIVVLLAVSPLFFSYNMLSHDVFNYIFNARMVVNYQTNPHIHTALEFPQDDWTRFMHNTHTPAPYGEGWTIISLLPYLAGLGKFTFTWLVFRAWSVLSFALTVCAVYWLAQRIGQKISLSDLVLVFFNPLLIVETISTIHNDLWMMMPAIFGMGFIIKPGKNKLLSVLVSVVLLSFSASMKLASVVLFPLWLFFFFYHFSVLARVHQILLRHKLKKFAEGFSRLIACVQSYWAELAALFFFIPLLTDRSQQFHPWYLTWLLVWIPFMHKKWLKGGIIVLSMSSLMRYLPWLWTGNFSDQGLIEEKLITWIPLFVFLAAYFLRSRLHSSSKSNFTVE